MYYLHPTDEQLRSLAGIPKDKGKKGKGGGKGNNKGGGGGTAEDDGTFTVPRSLDLTLETSCMVPGEVMQLKFYTEYQWLLDFSLCAAVVYIITEVCAKASVLIVQLFFFICLNRLPESLDIT